MKINKRWLPVKVHYFFFFAAMGPILPQIPVYGKELGISSVAMGTITGLLPFAFLLAKPLFGLLVDVFRNYRKFIFIMLIIIMTLFYAALYFIPPKTILKLHLENVSQPFLDTCLQRELECTNRMTKVICNSNCLQKPTSFLVNYLSVQNYEICIMTNTTLWNNLTCDLMCEEDLETDNNCIYKSLGFWCFVIFMCVGTIGFNVVNSITDAICFDVIGDEGDYGRQRVWGTVGYGVTALISGYIVDFFSTDIINYTPAFVIMLICAGIDLISCVKIQLPIIEAPKNLFRDFKEMLKDSFTVTFLTFAIFAGILDSLMVFFLLWYLEDLAVATNTSNIKLIQGLTVAAETMGGEIIFFSVSGKILKYVGHVHCFSMCFFSYALRIGLISLASSPWWIIPIEFCLNGPSYALTYSTIVAYANDLAPPGASATMQGIAAGMDDGLGFAVGGILAGCLFKYIGAKQTLQVFSAFGVFCGISHVLLHRTVLNRCATQRTIQNVEYKAPDEAYKQTAESSMVQ